MRRAADAHVRPARARMLFGRHLNNLREIPMSVRSRVKIAGKKYVPGADHGVATLMTAAGWVLQRLPGAVLEEQREELVRTLGDARDLVVEVHCRPSIVLVRDGDRALLKIPANGVG